MMLLALGGCARKAEQNVSSPPSTSMISLIAKPECFRGKEVSVQGYLGDLSGSYALYLSPNDAACVNTSSAIWIGFRGDGRYHALSGQAECVVVRGIFSDLRETKDGKKWVTPFPVALTEATVETVISPSFGNRNGDPMRTSTKPEPAAHVAPVAPSRD